MTVTATIKNTLSKSPVKKSSAMDVIQSTGIGGGGRQEYYAVKILSKNQLIKAK
jgi:hypothetical protein